MPRRLERPGLLPAWNLVLLLCAGLAAGASAPSAGAGPHAAARPGARSPVVVAAAAVATAGQACVPAIRLEKPPPDSLMSAVFAIDRPIEVSVEAVGLLPRLSAEYSATAWLLDTASRATVWALDRGPRRELPESRFLRGGADRVRLEPGTYALYLYASSRWRTTAPFKSWSTALNDLADLLNHESPGKDLKPYLERIHVALTQPAGEPPALRPCAIPPRAGALVALAPAGIKADLAQGFRLERATALRCVAIGKSMRDTTVLLDYGWIERAEDGGTAWRMDGARCRHAGGARKNRGCDEEVSLPAGDYVARFGTDDVHAAGNWNAVPPRDPDGWGLVILPGAGYRSKELGPLAESTIRRGPGILARMVRVRVDEHRRQEFQLARETRVRVDALGEQSRGGLVDYGWIADAATGATLWKMTLAATGPAGGGEKNRAFTGELVLPAGRYEAHYVGDDSHAWGDWNSAPPREPHEWGMTIRIVAAPR